jgi:nitrogen fixation/metabolism regulation signal transduction histidine kinase
MRSSIGRTIVLALLALAIAPLAAAAYLLDGVIDASDRVAAGEAELRQQAVRRARAAYTELFAARKAALRDAAARLAHEAGPLDGDARRALVAAALARDPALKAARLLGAGAAVLVEGRSTQPLGDDAWRELRLVEPLAPDQSLELVYVTPRAPFNDLDALAELEGSERGLGLLRARVQRAVRLVFLAVFALVVAAATAFGLWLARRLARRVTALVAATRAVGAGDLEARVAVDGSDEIADLGQAFNQMVRELKDSRDRISYLQKISAWQEVARRLAHEIKNPLTPIQLAVQQLHDSYPVGAPSGDARYAQLLHDATEIVGEEIGALRRLVDEFSTFAKLPRVEAAPLDGAAAIEELLRGYSGFEGKVQFVAPPAPVPMRADRMLLKRALFNLVENALQAGARTVTLRLDARGAQSVISVEDDGPGLPPELGERAFDPYVTTKEHGTGLGLAIVKKIALEHGGSITAGRADGGGARFELSLPRS